MNYIKNATIFVIDNEVINLVLMQEYLSDFCKEIILESDVEIALELVIKKQPDIILLDIVMDNIDGYEVCQRLKNNDKTAHIPVIFLSALIKTTDKVKGFEAGGVDYISKPFEIDEVLARIESCLKVHQKINYLSNKGKNVEEEIKRHHLTEREIDTLRLYVLGYQRNEIAVKLGISENTIKWHLKNILAKLKVKNRTQAIEKAREIGLLN